MNTFASRNTFAGGSSAALAYGTHGQIEIVCWPRGSTPSLCQAGHSIKRGMQRRARTWKNFQRASFGFLITVTCSALCSCTSSGSASPRPNKLQECIFGMDMSPSNKHQIQPGLVFASQLGTARGNPPHLLTAFSVDSSCKQILNRVHMPRSGEAFLEQVSHRLSFDPNQRKTRVDEFWVAAERHARSATGPVAILLITDGFPDGVSIDGHRAIHTVAKLLAANPRIVSVTIVGAKSGTYETLRADLGALGNRLRIVPLEGQYLREVVLFPSRESVR